MRRVKRPVEQRRRQKDPAVLPDPVDDLLIEPIDPFQAQARRSPPKCCDGQIGRRAGLEPEVLNLRVEIARQEQLLVERGAKGLRPQEDERQPHAERPEMLRELGRHVGGRDLARLPQGVLQVVAGRAEGRREPPGVAHQHDARAPGEEQTLVRVEDDPVRPLDAPHDVPAVLGQEEEAAVRRVDVEPAALALGDRRDGVERIDRAGVRRAGRGEDQPRLQTPTAVGGDGFFQRLGAHAEALVDRDGADLRLPQAGDVEGLLEAVMRLAGQVDDRGGVVGGLEAMGIAGRGDRRQAGDAASGCDVAAGCGGIADEIGHPAEQQVLHPDRSRTVEEDGRVFVADSGQIVAQRCRVDGTARDVGQMAP